MIHLITGLEVGGAERTLNSLLRASSGLDVRHVVVTMTNVGPIGKELAAAGVEVHELKMGRGRLSPLGLLRMVRILRRSRPCLLHCWMYHANLLGLVAGKLARISGIIWSIRCSEVDFSYYRPLTRWVVWISALLSRFAGIIIVNSEAGRRVHETLGFAASKMVVIPNGIDSERFKPNDLARSSVRAELRISEDKLLIGLIARFDPMKDHATFFQAAGRLSKRNQDVHFVLAGSEICAENAALCRMICENCLQDSVHLLGLREDIARLTSALDIASLSSQAEAFPNVVGEAMACGVPCVVTDVGDSAYIVAETGLVVQPKDPEGLAAGWATLIGMGKGTRQALGWRARKRIQDNFSVEMLVRKHVELYEKLLSLLST